MDIKDALTEEQMDEIQEELKEHIKSLGGVEAELMALHFGFSTSHTVAVFNGWNEKRWREHMQMCLDKYLEGNPFTGGSKLQ